jgi:large subunit ribosomal protein L9
MKVILLSDVEGLGKKGSICEVSDGYAINYLVPRKLAMISTPATQAKLQKATVNEETKQLELKKEAEALAARLEHISVEFKAKVGNDGRMFGTISPKEIVEGMEKQWGIKIDKRKFIDKYPVNALGYTRLRIELYKGSAGQVIGTVIVHVSKE